MRLSGHNYNNSVSDSLLDNLINNLEKRADGQNTTQKVAHKLSSDAVGDAMNFTSVTEDTLRGVQSDHLDFIAKELAFAAEKSRIAISEQDFVRFASQVIDEGLRGKKLERAAARFCNDLGRDSAPPQGTTRTRYAGQSMFDEQSSNHSVIPAGYNPQHGQNDRKTGGYMGQSRNPNTIWDTEAMQRLAQQKFGDEKIKESRQAQEAYRHNQKLSFWTELQERLEHPDVIQQKTASVANISTVAKSAGNQQLPSNAMSMFSNEREFENIPEQTEGEKIAKAAWLRAQKKEASVQSQSQEPIQPARKADNTLSGMFAQAEGEVPQRTNTHRVSVDKIFEGLLKTDFFKK